MMEYASQPLDPPQSTSLNLTHIYKLVGNLRPLQTIHQMHDLFSVLLQAARIRRSQFIQQLKLKSNQLDLNLSSTI